MARNIEMNIKTGSGYEVLYPSSTPSQVGSVSLSGDTMTGDLILSSTTSNDMGAINKGYVDTQISSLNTTLSNRINGVNNTVNSLNSNFNRMIPFQLMKLSNVSVNDNEVMLVSSSSMIVRITYIIIHLTDVYYDENINFSLYVGDNDYINFNGVIERRTFFIPTGVEGSVAIYGSNTVSSLQFDSMYESDTLTIHSRDRFTCDVYIYYL